MAYMVNFCVHSTTDDYGIRHYCGHPKVRNTGIWRLIFGKYRGCTELGKLADRWSCPYFEHRLSRVPPRGTGGVPCK